MPPREPYATPEREKEYPEPSMFGMLPAYGFFIRHAKGIELNDVEVGFMKEDRRPAFVLESVKAAAFSTSRRRRPPESLGSCCSTWNDFSVHGSPLRTRYSLGARSSAGRCSAEFAGSRVRVWVSLTRVISSP